MKIALVVHDLREHGGHSLYTKILADHLSRSHDVAVFANSCEEIASARWDFRQVLAWRSSALACVQTFPLGLRAHANALTEYDICHSQGYCGGRPNVVTAHVCVEAYLNSLRGVSLRHRLSLQLMSISESRFYRRLEGHVIAVSQKVAHELQEFYGVSLPIKVIPHGVDISRFNMGNRDRYRAEMRRVLHIKENETVALYVGDLTKAHSYLKSLSTAAPNIRFLIVTPSRAYHWDEKNVQILPPTSAIERFYAAADAFVFPTTYDAFGMVLLEAMASGLPVFSSDCAGAAELICVGSDGFATSLTDWVEHAVVQLRDIEMLRHVGVAAAETAKRHSWPSVVTEVEKLYFEVLAK